MPHQDGAIRLLLVARPQAVSPQVRVPDHVNGLGDEGLPAHGPVKDDVTPLVDGRYQQRQGGFHARRVHQGRSLRVHSCKQTTGRHSPLSSFFLNLILKNRRKSKGLLNLKRQCSQKCRQASMNTRFCRQVSLSLLVLGGPNIPKQVRRWQAIVLRAYQSKHGVK